MKIGLQFKLIYRITVFMNHNVRSARRRFGFEFSVLARQWRRILERQLEQAGLTDATWAPLLHLERLGDGVTQKALAAAVGIDGSSLVRLLDILAAKTWIERRIGDEDRRARLIHLTPDGRAAVERVRAILYAAEEPLLEGLSDEELAAAVRLFEKLSPRIRRILEAQDEGEA